MAVTSVATGTQTAVINTEHVLTTQTAAGVYILVVELTNLAAGDAVTLRIKTKYATGGTSRLAYSAIYANALEELNSYSIPVPVDTEIVCTLKQTDGTGRDFPWNLLKV